MAELSLSAPFNEVIQRSGLSVFVENFKTRTPAGFESFSSGTAGPRITDYEEIKFEGEMVIEDLTRAFPGMAIRDFSDRALSSFTLTGVRFNAGPSGLFMGVTTATSNQTISTSASNLTAINVVNNEKFYDTGHLFTSQRSLIEYTSKAAGVFFGYVVSGPNTLNTGDELVQFSGPE
ncbi:virion structural protein [Cyanophage S-RIM44]|uniref:Virion structural protein n=2 Tax=Vellamovirus TaxID=2733139 RepID=A0A127KN18_9CAUD|nr:virion structural protein [Prochlorococcus phage Syn1]AMO43338.1 virion structural protein [Cyanophage S-RIM44]ADO99196.1 virion structural protein [Prochlorococcus phage Syn1]AOO11810.1 virion structural protein [Cyanophage S-RIM44]AOO12511.1 virion structural protein [Cyanophage S-RIM44]AOO12977.1 virion structural protein [Cyanophage S-RIM44]